MKKTLTWIAIAAIAWCATSLASAATIPAGTVLVVRTLDTITSVDVPGTRFSAQLSGDVVVNGKVALRAGTKLSGTVVTSRRTYASSQRFTVDITEATVGGRHVPIKTGASQVDNTRYKTRNDVSVSRAGYSVPAGRIIQFRLAQPVQL